MSCRGKVYLNDNQICSFQDVLKKITKLILKQSQVYLTEAPYRTMLDRLPLYWTPSVLACISFLYVAWIILAIPTLTCYSPNKKYLNWKKNTEIRLTLLSLWRDFNYPRGVNFPGCLIMLLEKFQILKYLYVKIQIFSYTFISEF